MWIFKSFVPDLLVKKGWTISELVEKCVRAGIARDIAMRLAEGDTNIPVVVLIKAAYIFRAKSISDIINIVDDGR